jgi:hypothetical protein
MANNSTGQNLDEDILQCRADIERLRATIMQHSRLRNNDAKANESDNASADEAKTDDEGAQQTSDRDIFDNDDNIITVSKIEDVEVEKPSDSNSEDNVRIARQAINKMREQIRRNKQDLLSLKVNRTGANETVSNVDNDETKTSSKQQTNQESKSLTDQNPEQKDEILTENNGETNEIKEYDESVTIPSFEEVIKKHAKLQQTAKNAKPNKQTNAINEKNQQRNAEKTTERKTGQRKKEESLAWLDDAEELGETPQSQSSDSDGETIIETDNIASGEFDIQEIENWAKKAEQITGEHNKTKQNQKAENQEKAKQAEATQEQELRKQNNVKQPEKTVKNKIPQFDLSRQSMSARRSKVARQRKSPRQDHHNNDQKGKPQKVDKVAKTINDILTSAPAEKQKNRKEEKSELGGKPKKELIKENRPELTERSKPEFIIQTQPEQNIKLDPVKQSPLPELSKQQKPKQEKTEELLPAISTAKKPLTDKISLGCSRILDELEDNYLENTIISDIVERDIAEHFANQDNEATAA